MAHPDPPPAQPEIRLEYSLDPDLFPEGSWAARLSGRLQQALQQTVQTLGLPARVAVAPVNGAQGGPQAREGHPVYISLHGKRLVFPADLYAQAYHLASGTPLDWAVQGDALGGALAGLAEAQLEEFLFLVLLEAVHLQPQRLLSAEVAAAFGTQWADFPDPQSLFGILHDVLSLRLSLADREGVAEILSAGHQEGKNALALAEDLIVRLGPPGLAIELPRDLLKSLTLEPHAGDREAVALLRDGLFYELGLRFPDLRWSLNDELAPGTFRFRVNHLPSLAWRGVATDKILVNDTPDRLAAINLTAEASSNPINRTPCSLIPLEAQAAAKMAGLTVWTPLGYLVMALNITLRRHAGHFMDNVVQQAAVKGVSDAYPQLGALTANQVESPQLTRLLRLLLAEEISIRNLSRILQALLDFDTIPMDESELIAFDPRLAVPSEPAQAWRADPVHQAAFVRTTLKRYLSHKYTRGQNTLLVYLLDPEIENLLANDGQQPLAAHLAQITPEQHENILAAVRAELNGPSTERTSAVVLTVSGVRPVFRALIAAEFPHLPVLSYQELTPELNIQPISRITLPHTESASTPIETSG